MKKQKLGRGGLSLAMALISLTFVYPLVYMLINSLKSKEAYYINKFNLPGAGEWMVTNYTNMITQFRIFDLFRNTAFIVLVSTALIIVLGVFASFAIAKLKFRGRMVVYIAIIATIFMPAQVTIIPVYSMYAKIGLLNNPWSVIFSYIAANLPQTILLMVAFFRGIPQELLEAAEMDGCRFFSKIRHIVLPLGAPAIVINIITNVISLWNDLFVPMILLQRVNARTLMPALTALVQQTTNDPTFQMAGLFLATIPALVVYMCLQKYIVKGIMVGAIK